MRAAGLAFGETLILEGAYQVTPPLPYTPGNEGAGEIIAVGSDVKKFKVGDRVMIVSFTLSGGMLAEVLNVEEDSLLPLPDNLDFEQGAAFPSNYYTAYIALLRRGLLQARETLVVHGASGGLGLAAVQVGKMMGARVIATGASDRKLEAVRALGADHVINHSTEPLRERILELTGGRGADIFFDPVGGDIFDASMRAIAPGGRILVLGFTSGRFAVARTNILLVKGISVVGVDGRIYRNNSNGQGTIDLYDLLNIVGGGQLIPHVGAIFPFDQAKAGYEFVRDRQCTGKCVLRIA
jgi:NADPH:quinone reductase